MKNIFAVILLASSFSAMALPMSVDFSLDFNTGPVSSLTGSIVYQSTDDLTTIDSLISIDLTIDSYSYSLSEISFDNYVNSTTVGGTLCDVYCVAHGTNDFMMSWTRSGLPSSPFVYSLANDGNAYFGSNYSEFTISPVGVDEPAPLALLGIGLALMASSRKRNCSNS